MDATMLGSLAEQLENGSNLTKGFARFNHLPNKALRREASSPRWKMAIEQARWKNSFVSGAVY
jgi:hypothetical protein